MSTAIPVSNEARAEVRNEPRAEPRAEALTLVSSPSTHADHPAPFPEWPVGWYTVARSSDLKRGTIITRSLAGAEVVMFRADRGEVSAVAAHCPHMGAHLKHATVVGDALRCPMHHWSIDGAGEARRAAGPVGTTSGTPGSVHRESPCGRTRTWPVKEACGLVFVWVGGGEPGALPLPEGVADTAWRSGGPVAVNTPWYTLMISGFDMEHLSAVHGRRLVDGPHITQPDAQAEDARLHLRYTSMVSGGGMADRVMAWLGRNGIMVSMACSGPVFTVDTTIGRRRTRAILGLLPVGNGVQAYGSFGVMRSAWLARVQARIAAWLFIAFLRKDFAIIEGIALQPEVRDPGVRAMTTFLRGLPVAKHG